MRRSMFAMLSLGLMASLAPGQPPMLEPPRDPPLRSHGVPPITVDDFDSITAASLKRSRKNARRLRENGASR